MPDRRLANIEEAERVLRGLPSVTLKYFDYIGLWFSLEKEFDTNVDILLSIDEITQGALKIMQEVLQDSFIQGWNAMNLRHYMADSYELSELIMDSADVTDQATWREAIRMRLQEKLIASERILDKLSRVHDAFHNIVPLLNSTVTPNGSYNAFFLTGTLFKSSPEIHETYIRLRNHINKFTENIDGLYHIYFPYKHEIELKDRNLNYCIVGLMQASEGYDRDLRIYESLVIRQPLQRIETAKTEIQECASDRHAKWLDFETSKGHSQHIYEKTYKYWLEFNKTDTSGKIAAYWDNLKNYRHVSKLDIANYLTSHRITKLAELNKEYLSRLPKLIGSKMIRLTCDKLSSIPPPLYLNNISLQDLTSFINGLKTYLEKTRLNGHFFRYVVVICTLCLQRWRIVTGSTPRSRAVPVSLNR